MPDKNKVLYGMSDLYIGTYTVDADGNVQMGTPYHQAGAVGWSADPSSENYKFFADNVEYFSYYTSGSYEGDLVVAKFDDEFKKLFLGYVELDDGGLAEIKNAIKPSFYVAFEIQGDKGPERVIFYNGTLGAIKREYATIEESVEVQTETIQLSITGDNKTGMSKVGYDSSKAGFETLFTNPPAPRLPDASE